MVLWDSARQKYPVAPWLTIMAWGAACGIVGSKLMLVTGSEWCAALHEGHMPAIVEKTYLGGIVGGIIGVVFARRLLGFRFPVLDAFAVASATGLAIGRIGCLLGGCCHGTPTTLPWAIAYPIGSHAYHLHLSRGLIGAEASTSLPVHPTQAYEILLLCALAVLLWKSRKILKRAGSLSCLYIVSYGVIRFCLEFMREGGSLVWQLKTIQWALIPVILSAMGLLLWREQGRCVRRTATIPPAYAPVRTLIVLVPIAVLVVFARDWFTPVEATVLTIAAALSLSTALIHAIPRLKAIHSSWAKVTVVASAMLLGSGSDTSTPPDTLTKSFFDLSVGGMKGSYMETCGPQHHYTIRGVGICYGQQVDSFTVFKVGVRGYSGEDVDGGAHGVFGVNPYVRADTRLLGLGAGTHMGDLYLDGHYEGGIRPQTYIRLGPCDKLYAEARISDHFPGSRPAPVFQIGVGVGLEGEGGARFGVSDAGFYVNPCIPVGGMLRIEPFLAAGDDDTYQLALTLHFRLTR